MLTLPSVQIFEPNITQKSNYHKYFLTCFKSNLITNIKTSQNIWAGNFALCSVLLTSFTPIIWKIQLSNVIILLIRQKINGLLHLIY